MGKTIIGRIGAQHNRQNWTYNVNVSSSGFYSSHNCFLTWNINKVGTKPGRHNAKAIRVGYHVWVKGQWHLKLISDHKATAVKVIEKRRRSDLTFCALQCSVCGHWGSIRVSMCNRVWLVLQLTKYQTPYCRVNGKISQGVAGTLKVDIWPQSNPVDGKEEKVDESQSTPSSCTLLSTNQSSFLQLTIIPTEVREILLSFMFLCQQGPY